MTRSLTGKVALVTGAAKGIGAGIAKAMAAVSSISSGRGKVEGFPGQPCSGTLERR